MTSNARPSATVTPSPAHSAPRMPTASAMPLPVSGSAAPATCEPSTGICASVESTTSSRSAGSSSRTKPSTETSASSSGKTEKNA